MFVAEPVDAGPAGLFQIPGAVVGARVQLVADGALRRFFFRALELGHEGRQIRAVDADELVFAGDRVDVRGRRAEVERGRVRRPPGDGGRRGRGGRLDEGHRRRRVVARGDAGPGRREHVGGHAVARQVLVHGPGRLLRDVGLAQEAAGRQELLPLAAELRRGRLRGRGRGRGFFFAKIGDDFEHVALVLGVVEGPEQGPQVEGPAAARGDAAHGPVAPPDGVAPRGLRQGHLEARPAGAVAPVAAARDDEVAARRHADGAGRNRRVEVEGAVGGLDDAGHAGLESGGELA